MVPTFYDWADDVESRLHYLLDKGLLTPDQYDEAINNKQRQQDLLPGGDTVDSINKSVKTAWQWHELAGMYFCSPSTVRPQLFALNYCSPSTVCLPQLTSSQ